MGRDLFRGIIRTALVLCLMASCVETLYFIGQLSHNSSDIYSPYYNGSNDYYNRSNTIESTEVQDTIIRYDREEYGY